MKKTIFVTLVIIIMFPTVVYANIRCKDGTYSPTCTYNHSGCCSHHGGVASYYSNYDEDDEYDDYDEDDEYDEYDDYDEDDEYDDNNAKDYSQDVAIVLLAVSIILVFIIIRTIVIL